MIKIGDIVLLNSGGPAMTVDLIETASNVPGQALINCCWFGDRELMRDGFLEAQLVKVSNDE
jgi:uncharacterized protein YodC (DUF2158 family)